MSKKVKVDLSVGTYHYWGMHKHVVRITGEPRKHPDRNMKMIIVPVYVHKYEFKVTVANKVKRANVESLTPIPFNELLVLGLMGELHV